LGELLLNWNSDFLAAFINFLSGSPSLATYESTAQLQPENVLMIGVIRIRQVDLYMNNVRSGEQLGLARIEAGYVGFEIRNSGYYFKGDLGNLTISDLTDYPHTLERREVSEPFKIFTNRQPSDSLLKFDIAIYEYEMMTEDIGSDVPIHLNSAQLVYFQQPMFRIIDFFNYEMLGVFDKEMR
jgi:hypothetical protein